MNIFRKRNRVRIETKWTALDRVEHHVYRGQELITSFVQTPSKGFSFVTPLQAREAANTLKTMGANWKEVK